MGSTEVVGLPLPQNERPTTRHVQGLSQMLKQISSGLDMETMGVTNIDIVEKTSFKIYNESNNNGGQILYMIILRC